MGGSLRDQLVKAGLATADQARKAEKQARAERRSKPAADSAAGTETKQPNRKARKNKPAGTTAGEARARARKLTAEKAEHNRALAAQVNEKARERALRAELKQLIFQHDQREKTTRDDDVPYNFVHGKKVKRIYVPTIQRDQLSAGKLVIVNNDGRYHLVASDIAERIRERDPKRIIAAHDQKPQNPDPEDEYYAKFKVPDDLDW